MKKKLLYFHTNPVEANCFGVILMVLGISMLVVSPMTLIYGILISILGLGFLIYGMARVWYIEYRAYQELLYKRMQKTNKMDIEVEFH